MSSNILQMSALIETMQVLPEVLKYNANTLNSERDSCQTFCAFILIENIVVI